MGRVCKVENGRKENKRYRTSKITFENSKGRFNFFSSKPFSIFVLEGIYESIMELCHAILALEGFKTLSHECAIEFLRGKYIDDYEAEILHKLRKKRHEIKYYGKIISEETIKVNLEKGKSLFLKLKLRVEKAIKNQEQI